MNLGAVRRNTVVATNAFPSLRPSWVSIWRSPTISCLMEMEMEMERESPSAGGRCKLANAPCSN